MDDIVLRARLDALEKQVKLLMNERNAAIERIVSRRIRQDKEDRYLDKLAAELTDPNQ